MMSVMYLSVILAIPLTAGLTVDDYEMMPPLYDMEDYNQCMRENKMYCKAYAKLRSSINDSYIWRIIKETSKDQNYFDRSNIQRGICIPLQAGDTNLTKSLAEARINKKLKDLNLRSTVHHIICTTKQIEISTYDKIVAMILLNYILFVIYATLSEITNESEIKAGKESYTPNKLLPIFSIISNWKKITRENQDEDRNNLKAIQGIRFYNMVLIFILHMGIAIGQTFVSNPNILEVLTNNPIVSYFHLLAGVMIQTFLLISSLLVTVQVKNAFRDHGKFTARHAGIMILNRYFRLTVTSAVVVALMRTSWPKFLNGPHTFEVFNYSQKTCNDHWLKNLLLINNYYPFGESCNLISWYLSADFHLYVATVFTFYFIFKYNLDEKKVLGLLLIISCMVYGFIIYIYDTNITVKPNINSIQRPVFMNSIEFIIIYTSTHSNWSTSLVGAFLGSWYFKNKNKSLKFSKATVYTWALIFFGLPFLVLVISDNQFRGISAVILGPLRKPLFALGIGVGILGMSKNLGGIAKKICENRYVDILSNFTFSGYLFQHHIVFIKGLTAQSPLEVGIFFVVTSIGSDLILCMVVGIIGTLLVEQPGLNLQKLLLPQIKKARRKIENNNIKAE